MANSFRDVIALWGSADRLAANIGIGRYRVRNWNARNYILGEYWNRIIATKTARRNGVTLKALADIAERTRLEI